MSRPIPELRDELRLVADEVKMLGYNSLAAWVTAIADDMHRKPANRMTEVKPAKMTESLAREIRRYAQRQPEASLVEIAREFSVNPSRVSEAISHAKTWDD